MLLLQEFDTLQTKTLYSYPIASYDTVNGLKMECIGSFA